MRAGRMSNNQHFIHIAIHCRCDFGLECRYTNFKFGRIGTARLCGICVIMHQVIGEKLGILSLEPAQHGPKRNTATDKARYDCLRQPTRPESHWPVDHRFQQSHAFANQQGRYIKCQTCQKQLNQQHSNRIKRCDNWAFAQLHQPPQCTCRDVNPCRANKLPVGRSNRIGHTVTHDVRPNQHLSIDMDRTTINDAVDLPAIVATTLFGAER